MASNGLKLMKEKFKAGTGEQLWTHKVIRKIDTEGGYYECRQSRERAAQTLIDRRSVTWLLKQLFPALSPEWHFHQ